MNAAFVWSHTDVFNRTARPVHYCSVMLHGIVLVHRAIDDNCTSARDCRRVLNRLYWTWFTRTLWRHTVIVTVRGHVSVWRTCTATIYRTSYTRTRKGARRNPPGVFFFGQKFSLKTSTPSIDLVWSSVMLSSHNRFVFKRLQLFKKITVLKTLMYKYIRIYVRLKLWDFHLIFLRSISYYHVKGMCPESLPRTYSNLVRWK